MSISSFWVHSSDLTTQMTPLQTSVCIGNKPNRAYWGITSEMINLCMDSQPQLLRLRSHYHNLPKSPIIYI
jgi:hypothetical protein